MAVVLASLLLAVSVAAVAVLAAAEQQLVAQQPRIDKAAAVDHTEFVVADHIHSRHIVAADH